MNIIDYLEQDLGIHGKPAATGWYRACCPIHGEKSPSFAVNMHYPYIYNCLACGAGGQIAGLTSIVKNMPFRAAVEYVRDRLSLDVSDVERLLFKPEKDPFISTAVLTAFQECLSGSPGLKYCRRRGIPRYVLEQFGVGYEPLKSRLLVPLYAAPEMRRAVGFDVRGLGVEVEKSVEVADGWRKKSLLFPVNAVNTFEGVIAVEGFFDAARVMKWLVESGKADKYLPAAICGNRVSQHHAEFFSRFDRICCGFDNDSGGHLAEERLYQLLPERSLQRLIFSGDDPGDSPNFSIVSI
jgi:DNA primase